MSSRMYRPLYVCAIVTLVFAASAFAGFSQSQAFRPASAAELSMKSVPYAPDATAAVLDWVKVNDDSNSIASEYVRIKVFTDDGKKYGSVEIPYLPAYPFEQRVTEISARTIRPDGTIVPFDGKVYDKVVFKYGRAAVKQKTFSLPDVQAGSIIEYRYQLRWRDY